MRHPLVMGNWKLNGSSKMVHELITALRHEIGNVTGCDVAIAPPAIYLSQPNRFWRALPLYWVPRIPV